MFFVLQLATSPFRTQLEQISDALSGVSPDLMRQVGPLLSQLSPIYMDVAQGKAEFTPVPAETRKLIRSYYGVTSLLSHTTTAVMLVLFAGPGCDLPSGLFVVCCR